MFLCFKKFVRYAIRLIRIGHIKQPESIVQINAEGKLLNWPESCRLLELALDRGTMDLKAGLKDLRMLDSKRVIKIVLGTGAPVESRIEIRTSGNSGEKVFLKETTTLVNYVGPEEESSIQTILSALHTMKNSALKLAMEEPYAKLVIELRPTTATIVGKPV